MRRRRAVREALAETEGKVEASWFFLKKELEKLNKAALKGGRKSAQRTRHSEKVEIDREKIRQSMRKESEAERLEALKRMSSAMFYRRTPYVEEKTETFKVKGVPDCEHRCCKLRGCRSGLG